MKEMEIKRLETELAQIRRRMSDLQAVYEQELEEFKNFIRLRSQGLHSTYAASETGTDHRSRPASQPEW